MNERLKRIITVGFKIIAVLTIIFYAYSITPKTFQNDTFYTIKIGEHISNTTENVTDLLPWNKGLDMKDPFSMHELPYTYPHWFYDLITYKIHNAWGLQGIYVATCILAIILGLSIYFVNRKLNGNYALSFIITIGTLFCLKDFIAARAQLVTFILFVYTIYGIEQFIKSKKIRYAILLLIIPILIANMHCAVWPFYFVLYLPYIVEYIFMKVRSINYGNLFRKIKIKFKKNKISKLQLNIEKNKIKKDEEKYHQKLNKLFENSYKIEFEQRKNTKWLILILLICIFTGLLTPIKETPYTYLIKTNQGNTTQNISEHLPLTLANDETMMIVFAGIIGILVFSKSKIKLKDFFMLSGLVLLAFLSRRQKSMLVLIGNFILVRMLINVFININKTVNPGNKIKDLKTIFEVTGVALITIITFLVSAKSIVNSKNDQYVDESSYPVAAAEFINKEIIPKVGKENLKLYNEYNYGSYLLFSDIPVFIDSRADLYAPEFNGQKDENGNYIGNDIFTDFLDISSLAVDYESKFEEYEFNYAIMYSNAKLSSVIERDNNYRAIYDDGDFVIYEKVND